MAQRSKLEKCAATDLVVDKRLNFRIDYDVPSMIDEILHARRVLEPLHVRKEDNVVLKGNRRTEAVQQMLLDPKLPGDIRNNIETLDVIYHAGLTEKETTELILDHGSQKRLSRTEIVTAVWRLVKQMYSEEDIIILLYHLLADYTRNQQKAHEASAIKDPDERKKFLKTWLHGTVGNYIMSAGTMTQEVRDQFLLNETAADRTLTEEEKAKLVFDTGRTNINRLSGAKKKDKDGAGWTVKDGGVEFNKMIAELKAEFAGTGTEKDKAPTKAQMGAAAESMQSDLGLVYQHCAGTLDKSRRADLDALDVELYRLTEFKKTLRPIVDRIDAAAKFSGGEVRQLMNLFLTGTAPEMEQYAARFAPQKEKPAKVPA